MLIIQNLAKKTIPNPDSTRKLWQNIHALEILIHNSKPIKIQQL
jgi:hypothetical protein